MITLSSFQCNKPLAPLSTFGIGGPARYFIEAKSIGEFQEIITFCFKEKIPYHILGKGSNSLFDDRGFNGAVILNKVDFIDHQEAEFHVGAGYSFSLLGTQTARKGWTGLEFASGIPGSVGGAVYMNAGANGGETADNLQSVTFVSHRGELSLFERKGMVFGYRQSPFHQIKGAIVAATFMLNKAANAREKQLTLLQYRLKTQPYNQPSAGCVFKNPSGSLSAGALIDQCGLKGKQVGGAQVSPLHGNFIVNLGIAKASDVLALLALVKNEILEKTGIELREEIRVLPYELSWE